MLLAGSALGRSAKQQECPTHCWVGTLPGEHTSHSRILPYCCMGCWLPVLHMCWCNWPLGTDSACPSVGASPASRSACSASAGTSASRPCDWRMRLRKSSTRGCRCWGRSCKPSRPPPCQRTHCCAVHLQLAGICLRHACVCVAAALCTITLPYLDAHLQHPLRLLQHALLLLLAACCPGADVEGDLLCLLQQGPVQITARLWVLLDTTIHTVEGRAVLLLLLLGLTGVPKQKRGQRQAPKEAEAAPAAPPPDRRLLLQMAWAAKRSLRALHGWQASREGCHQSKSG